jgi:integrase
METLIAETQFLGQMPMGIQALEVPTGLAVWSQCDGNQGYTLIFERYVSRLEPKTANAFLKELLPRMPKWREEEVIATLRQHYVTRYKKLKSPKYGKINKGFTESELKSFLDAVKIPKMRLLFNYQAQLGLRIGEVVKVNIDKINFETREFTLRTEKSRVLDTLLIPLPLMRETVEFIKANAKEVEESRGYLFFANKSYSHRKEPYLEANYVRNVFRKTLHKVRLDEIYDISMEQNGRRPRRLHRLTTHSLRHFAITRFAKQAQGNLILTSKFARHIDPSTTTTYINVDKKEIYEIVDRIAVDEVNAIKRRLGTLNQ